MIVTLNPDVLKRCRVFMGSPAGCWQDGSAVPGFEFCEGLIDVSWFQGAVFEGFLSTAGDQERLP